MYFYQFLSITYASEVQCIKPVSANLIFPPKISSLHQCWEWDKDARGDKDGTNSPGDKDETDDKDINNSPSVEHYEEIMPRGKQKFSQWEIISANSWHGT